MFVSIYEQEKKALKRSNWPGSFSLCLEHSSGDLGNNKKKFLGQSLRKFYFLVLNTGIWYGSVFSKAGFWSNKYLLRMASPGFVRIRSFNRGVRLREGKDSRCQLAGCVLFAWDLMMEAVASVPPPSSGCSTEMSLAGYSCWCHPPARFTITTYCSCSWPLS
jgi:hypothetical protein